MDVLHSCGGQQPVADLKRLVRTCHALFIVHCPLRSSLTMLREPRWVSPTQVAERLAGSPHAAAGAAAGLSTTTLRAVYSLVGNKHIKIDRSGGEATAVSLLL